MDNKQKIDWSEHYLRKGDPKKPTYYVIRRRLENVGLFSNYIVFAGHIRYALDKGYLPVIDMKNYFNSALVPKELLGKENVWEYFFCQPFGLSLEDVYENGENVLLSSGDPRRPYPNGSIDYYTNRNNILTKWQTLVKLGFLNIRPDIYINIMDEFNLLFSPSDKILGVLLRGTDYASLKPPHHSVLPPINYALEKLGYLLKRWNCNKIFLATEDIKIVQTVKNHFGDICIVNEQERFEYDGNHVLNYYASAKKEDIIRNGISYLTGLVILSKCQCFATVDCSGSRGVMMMADGFEHTYLFNFGKYGTTSENFQGNHDVYSEDEHDDVAWILLQQEEQPFIEYRVHASSVGWMSREQEGNCAGDKKHGIEAIEVVLSDKFYEVYYSSYSNGEWGDEVSTGNISGTTGKSRRLNGIYLRFGEECDSYSIFYRVYFSNIGWSNWGRNGEKIYDDTQIVLGIEIKILSNRSELYSNRLLYAERNIENRINPYCFFVEGSEWLKSPNFFFVEQNGIEVTNQFLYCSYRIMDEYHPRQILEFNFGQASKMVAQYAAKYQFSHTILEHNRTRVEHFIDCWKVPWNNTTVYGSPLLDMEWNKKACVAYKNFNYITEDKKYDFVLLKCPFGGGIRIQVDILQKLPSILCDNFAILMDHVETEMGNLVFMRIKKILADQRVSCRYKVFSNNGRQIGLLVSESWKYVEEY